MATEYDGDPNAAQTPSPAPGPNVVVKIELPDDDTDDVNAASVAQGFKVAADGLTFANEAIGGTRSFKAVVIDGTGGASVVGAAGSLSVSGDAIITGDVNTGGDIVAGGTIEADALLYSSPITRSFWIATGWSQVFGGGGWSFSSSGGGWTSLSGANNIAIQIPIPVGPGTYTLTALTLRMKKASTGTTTMTAYYFDGMSSTSGNPGSHTAGTQTSATSGNALLQITGLSIVMDQDKFVSVDVNSANTGDIVWGVYATFTQTNGG